MLMMRHSHREMGTFGFFFDPELVHMMKLYSVFRLDRIFHAR